jgi:hypothetical protein
MRERALPASSLPSLEELEAYVQTLEGCSPQTRLEPFTEGHHNHVLRGYNGPTGPDKNFPDFVVRYPKHPAHSYLLHKEAGALALVGDRAPRVWDCIRLDSGVSIMLQEYVPGEPKPFNELTKSEIGKLAVTFSGVHAITGNRFSGRSGEEPNCCDGTYEDYVWAMIHESVRVRIDKVADLSRYPEAVPLLRAGMRLLHTRLNRQPDLFGQSGRPFSLQHHDANQNNVLWLANGACKLIDWNKTHGDPADELSYIFTDNKCSPAFKDTFLEDYQPPAGSGDVTARIPVYDLKNDLDNLAWTIERRELHPQETDPEEAEKYAIAYDEAVDTLASYV